MAKRLLLVLQDTLTVPFPSHRKGVFDRVRTYVAELHGKRVCVGVAPSSVKRRLASARDKAEDVASLPSADFVSTRAFCTQGNVRLNPMQKHPLGVTGHLLAVSMAQCL